MKLKKKDYLKKVESLQFLEAHEKTNYEFCYPEFREIYKQRLEKLRKSITPKEKNNGLY